MPSDPHQGGRLEDMARDGTSIPNDAGQQRTIPSVPRPDQNASSTETFGNLADAADNAFDIPRGVEDRAAATESITGTGDELTGNVGKKNLDDADTVPQAKGHDRYAKHVRQDNPYDRFVHKSHDVEPAPGEELESQEELLDKRGAR